jgi:hypothetical protein
MMVFTVKFSALLARRAADAVGDGRAGNDEARGEGCGDEGEDVVSDAVDGRGRKSQRPHRESCEFFRQRAEESIDFPRTKRTAEDKRHEVLPVLEAARRLWMEHAEN